MTARTRGIRALGLSAGASATPFVYAIVRIVQLRLQPEPDPGAVIWAEHSAFLSRLMVTGYIAAAVTVGALGLASVRPARMPLVAGALATLSAVAITLQAWCVP